MSSENEFVDFSNSGISVSVGVDIVDIERIKRMMNRWGSRFADRCFTSYELRTCRNKTSSL
ncbi:MAG: 4'-phosphopantetheinyl transferase superfamily protein, partial [Calditrichaeota bacterium]|nr:4'-phosphopantetheinyl transferase superfamily protein [Calditrichota bacterium]